MDPDYSEATYEELAKSARYFGDMADAHAQHALELENEAYQENQKARGYNHFASLTLAEMARRDDD